MRIAFCVMVVMLGIIPDAFAEVIVLACEGKTPVFDRGYQAGASYWAKKSQLITLDTQKKTATTMTITHRERTTDLRIDEQFYSFSFPMEFESEGMRIKSEDWSINRYTGDANGSLDVSPPPHGERGGYVTFDGKCVPSKPLF